MATINEKLKLSLDECRMLVLGTQVLISLQFELVFQSNFPAAPAVVKRLVPVGLGLMLAAFALLLWGPVYHRITLEGRPLPQAQGFMVRTMLRALLPISLAFGVDTFMVFRWMYGVATALVAGLSVSGVCSMAWYGLGLVGRASRSPEVVNAMLQSSKPPGAPGPLHDRVNQVMTEARVVLPGAQAMLGFQFITFFEKAFAELPGWIKTVHLICTGLIALTVVLLMTPAAFHRIADAGEDSERVVRVASRCVVGSMIPLSMGMAGDFFVIIYKVTGSLAIAVPGAGGMLALFVSLWFGYTLVRRRLNRF